jgi:DNA repair protein RadA/Sms
LDLPACLAIISSFVDKAVPRTTLVVGEVGLGGEIRNVSRLDTRLKEAKRLGFDRAIIPGSKQKISANMDIKRVRNIKEAVSYL